MPRLGQLAHIMFQFTRPRGARLSSAGQVYSNLKFQFTRPRGARRVLILSSPLPLVSIHAPARGATLRSLRKYFLVLNVSIHAPARGATAIRIGMIVGRSFNSRAREGRDVSQSSMQPVCMFQFTRPRGARQTAHGQNGSTELVSIHAPARGATYSSDAGGMPSAGFNSRAREGRDHNTHGNE